MENLDLKWRSELAKCKVDEVALEEANLCAMEAEVTLAEIRETIMANWKCVFERRSTLVGKEFIGRLDITKRQVKLMACRIENRIGLF